MKKQSITSIILMLCLNLFAATTINAQNTRRFVIDVPFQFAVAGQTLPAGKYAVERIDPTKPNLVMLKNTDNGMVRLVTTQRVEKDEPSTTSSLLFVRRGGKFYLSQVWPIGDKNGNQVPASHEINTSLRSTLVRLRIKNDRP